MTFKSLYQATPNQANGIADWPCSYSGGLIGNLSPQDWSLTVSGAIEKPTRFVFRNILALPQTTLERRIVSADGWSYKAQWQGVLIEEITKRIKPLISEDANASPLWILQENATGKQECLKLSDLLAAQAILCHHVNGQPLSPLHGGPVALMVFDRYHYKGLGQISSLIFGPNALSETDHGKKGYPVDGTISPGDYYAFDLKAFRPLHGPEQF